LVPRPRFPFFEIASAVIGLGGRKTGTPCERSKLSKTGVPPFWPNVDAARQIRASKSRKVFFMGDAEKPVTTNTLLVSILLFFFNEGETVRQTYRCRRPISIKPSKAECFRCLAIDKRCLAQRMNRIAFGKVVRKVNSMFFGIWLELGYLRRNALRFADHRPADIRRS